VAEGAEVLIADVDAETGRATAGELGAWFVGADRATEAGVQAMIGSVAGLGTSPHDAPEYAVAKAGVMRLTACLAPLHQQAGIRVNCVRPGLVDTPSSRRSRGQLSAEELAELPVVDWRAA
jgi:NAD(P)-dependent dehydrogenase (short-subunit alcohol dehydrogenase family)